MVAFAANSVLNRSALSGGGVDPVAFGLLRLVAGAAVLAPLALLRGKRLKFGGTGRAIGAAAMLVYVFGFSLAYLHLDAGLGALILFGCVQVTMFGGALGAGERVPPLRWAGALIAFAGLIWLLWPGTGSALGPAPVAAPAMAVAGAAWGVYSLAGRRGGDPLAGTAANFVAAAGVAVIGSGVIALWSGAGALQMDARGAALAVLSGAVTSGLGYALWYSVLPRLTAAGAGAAQLSVPVIAMAGGAVFLGEAITRDFVLGAVIVLGGVALSLGRRGR